MDWIYRRRRGQAFASLTIPPFHFIAIFVIVVFLLSFSHYADYKAQLRRDSHFLFFFVPFMLTFLVGYLLMVNGGLHYIQSSWIALEPIHRTTAAAAAAAGSFPWGVAILLTVLLVLLSYQPLFHSKWLGPL